MNTLVHLVPKLGLPGLLVASPREARRAEA
jgi:hypothetical protein